MAKSKGECAVCCDETPHEELAAHGGFCSGCHEGAGGYAAEIAVECGMDVEDVARIILAYENLKACTEMIMASQVLKGIPRRPRLHVPT